MKWHTALGWAKRHKVATGVLALLAVGTMGAAFDQDKDPATSEVRLSLSPPVALPGLPGSSRSAPSASDTPAPSPSAEATPLEKTVVETKAIPFERVKENDSTLARGKSTVVTRGVAGTERLTYAVTYTDGVETSRRLVDTTVVKAPVDQVTAIGTKAPPKPKPASNCDSNYSGACVPIAYDVDCSGGSGNGPAYVAGPVRVTGTDIYDLDRDGDGIACDS